MTSTTRRLAAGALAFATTAGLCLVGASAASAINDPSNTPPVAADDFYSVVSGETLTVSAPGILSNDSDFDGDALSTVAFYGFDTAETTLNEDGSFTMTPDPAYPGDRSFFYRAYDGFAMSDWVTVSVTVTPAPEPPVAPVGTPDTYTTQSGVPLNVPASGVLGNDVGGLAVVDVKDLPEGLTPNFDGSFSYLPPAGFVGDVSYSYRMSVGSDMLSDWILVTISVTPFVPVVVQDLPESGVLASTGQATGKPVAPTFALLMLGAGALMLIARRKKSTT